MKDFTVMKISISSKFSVQTLVTSFSDRHFLKVFEENQLGCLMTFSKFCPKFRLLVGFMFHF